jgi:hypothetical protein
MRTHRRWALVALVAIAGGARAQEEDDDPKATLRSAPPAKAPRPAAAAAPSPSSSPSAARPAQAARPSAPAVAAAPTPAASSAPSAPLRADSAAPPRQAVAAASPRPSPASPAGSSQAHLDPPHAAAYAFTDDAPLLELAAAPRPVRVRLHDGSSVTGAIVAEQPDTLVIECQLGRLAIPRERISSLTYDVAGAKDDKAPARRRPAP